MQVAIRDGADLPVDQVVALYRDAGWSVYASEPEKLMSALCNSSLTLSAWVGGELIGLARGISDGYFITYVQDILVKENYKRNGIGSLLMTQTLAQLGSVRQVVLLTDDNPETRGFYEKLGFSSCDRGEVVSFLRMNC